MLYRPKVLNKRHIIGRLPSNALYCGRPSQWGNPFAIGKDGTRSQVIEKYEMWLLTQPHLVSQLSILRGYDLVCWCAPLACHCDILLRYANKGIVLNNSYIVNRKTIAIVRTLSVEYLEISFKNTNENSDGSFVIDNDLPEGFEIWLYDNIGINYFEIEAETILIHKNLLDKIKNNFSNISFTVQ